MICQDSTKKVFYSKKSAHKAVKSLSKSVRVYQCDTKTHYHVTKQYKS